ASHLPNEPSRTCSGTQWICWFSSTIRSRNRVTATNHEDTALYTSGVSHRQQCGYECVYVSCRSTRPRAFSSAVIGLFVSKICKPWYGGTSAVNRVWSSTVTTVG